MTSQPKRFINGLLVETGQNIFTISNFTIINDGLTLNGTNSGNSLTGTRLNDVIWGHGGNDLIRGGAGNDFLNGGAGNDSVHGDAGNDRLEGWGGNDFLWGGPGDDVLFGGRGNDKLYGGAGDDYLCAGSGNDNLYGGLGRDVFVFRPEINSAASESAYMDFVPGVDRLRIEDYLFPSGFTKSMIKVDADGDLYINTSGGHLLTFETLGSADINALYDSISLI